MKKILVLLFCVPVFGSAQDIAKKADELLTAYSVQKKFSGNVLIARSGKVVFEKAYGFADLKNKLPNTLQTEFRAGSLTKMFTSALILKLASEQKLALTDPVSKYVSGIPYGDKITIQNLLSHSSGIAGYTAAPPPNNLAESVSHFKYDSLSFTPGSKFAYNNFNYILLSFIAEKIGNKPFSQLLKEQVIDVAELKHTGIDTEDRKSSNKALGYTTNPATGDWEIMNGGNVSIATGAGALYTTAGDLYQWSKAIAAGKVLPLEMVKKAQTVFQGNYGMGWIVNKDSLHESVGHTGSIEGFKAFEMIYPNDDSTVIIFLSNYQDLDGQGLADKLKAVVFNQPYTLPVQKNAIVLTADQLKMYAGSYKLNDNFKVDVTVEDNKLFALASGDKDKIELTPESENKFFLKGPETEIEFIKENGAVKEMFINMQGGMRLKKQ